VTEPTDDGVLFGVAELSTDTARMGRAEAGLVRALEQAEREGIITGLDGGGVGAALIAARKLDRADVSTASNAGYLVAQLMTPYREMLHALRLPAAIAPGGVPLPKPAESGDGRPSWLRDEFGKPTG